MKTLIINPPAVNDMKYVREGRCEQQLSSFQYLMVPISLPSIAAVLREHGQEIKLIDCIAADMPLSQLITVVEDWKPNLIVVNTSTVTFDPDREVAEALKQHCSAHITGMGVHVTTNAEESLKVALGFDSVIRREPELTVLALAEALQDGIALSSVEGISFRDGEKIVHNVDRPFIADLDSLPFPARDLLDNTKYLAPVSNKTQTLIVTSRGCTAGCIYCTAHCYYGKKVRYRSALSIVNEIEECVNKYNIEVITMWADTFTMNRKQVFEVCDEIIARGIKVEWMCNSRVDTVDLEMLKKMKSAGCSTMSYGVETGNAQIMKNIQKGITLSQVENAFKWTREAGIESMAHVIFGLPGETVETIKETKKFIHKIKPDYVQFYAAVPFPGTKLWKMAEENNWLITRDWSKFEINQAIISTPELDADELARQRTTAYREFYLRPSYMFNRACAIKSLDDGVKLVVSGWNFMKQWVMNK